MSRRNWFMLLCLTFVNLALLVKWSAVLRQWGEPPYLRIMCGRIDPNEMAWLWSAGATLREKEWGFELKPDRAAAEGLFRLCQYHVTCQDLCLDNIANARTSKTADGAPYRRKFAVMEPQGIGIRVSTEDFRWVYDPTNPMAEHEGKHAGYMAMPNINVASETCILRQHSRSLALYQRALARLEAHDPHLVATGVTDLMMISRGEGYQALVLTQESTISMDGDVTFEAMLASKAQQ